MPRIVLTYVLPLALMVYALVDCASDNEVERTSVPKAAWIVMIILIIYAGPIAWIVVSKVARPRTAGGPSGSGGRSGGPRRGPTAPDDDPEFLRRLAEEQARKRREQGRDKPDPS